MWRRLVTAYTALVIAALFAAAPVPAMEFTLKEMQDAAGEPVTVVLAEGEIEPGDAQLLWVLIHDIEVPAIAFDSHGGVMAEAMRIGQVIRGFRMEAAVPPGWRCVSACAYAFLGGSRRTAYPDSVVGVHQFRTDDGSYTEAQTQSLVAHTLGYVAMMGVDPGMVTIALDVPPDDMHVFTPEEMRDLRITIEESEGRCGRPVPPPSPPGADGRPTMNERDWDILLGRDPDPAETERCDRLWARYRL